MISLQISVTRHGVPVASESHTIAGRSELVRLTDTLISRHSLSWRARRQANLVLIWQAIGKRGSWTWRLRDTMGAGIEIRFAAKA